MTSRGPPVSLPTAHERTLQSAGVELGACLAAGASDGAGDEVVLELSAEQREMKRRALACSETHGSLTILQVAYPAAPVTPDAVGGAERVVSDLDAAVVAAGHRSIVVACEGSRCSGVLVAAAQPGRLDDRERGRLQRAHRHALRAALARWRVDVVHMHGIDFDAYLPPPGIPVLVTLHLPPSWYAERALRTRRPDTYLCCVSRSQRLACPPGLRMLAHVGNGVDVERLSRARPLRARRFAVALGRICPEKNFHSAMDAAAAAGVPFLLAGRVFPYDAHERYLRTQIAPRLSRRARFVGSVGLERKRRLLASARCLLVPSLAPETSSLIAMEALAAGTPVIAYPAGALAEIVEHGVTGFLVRDVEEMTAAIRAVDVIDPAACHAAARARYPLARMTERYLELYARIAAGAEALRSRGDDAPTCSLSVPHEAPERVLGAAGTRLQGEAECAHW